MKELASSPLVRWALGFAAVALPVAFLARLDSDASALIGILATPVLVVLAVIVVTLCGAWPAGREQERQRQGLCVRCEYDLRGIGSARCPECGHAIRRRRDPQPAEPK